MADTDDLTPDARDGRISELEQMVEDLEDTIRRQRDTVDALQQTNLLLAEQLEEKCKQLESSNSMFIQSRGLSHERSLSIDETSSTFGRDSFRKDSAASPTSDKDTSDANAVARYGNNAQSVQIEDDDVYSSGDDTQTYKTRIIDDHELLPLKQGPLKKKSENMHRYNTRYVVLYPSFLLYYDQCPIKSGSTSSSKANRIYKKNPNANNDINHPKGTIYLRNYHLSIRKDEKKKRYDITFVPHQSAVQMGLAAIDARIRFRCKTVPELMDWTDKIRTATTSASSGFITYDVRTDYINNDLSGISKANDDDSKEEDGEQNEAETQTKLFDIDDLKEMMQREEALKEEIAGIKREIVTLQHEKESLVTDLAMKTKEIECEHRMYAKQQKDFEAKIGGFKQHEQRLQAKIHNLQSVVSKMEVKQKEQHKRLKRYKYHEQDIQINMLLIEKWNKRMEESSLQYLGAIYPNCSNKKLFENCQMGCIGLLEEIYDNKMNRENMSDDMDSDWKTNPFKKRKESKISQEMMLCFTALYCKHIKTIINYASLQQAHNGVVEDFKLLKQDLEDFENDDKNTLADDALIMASITATYNKKPLLRSIMAESRYIPLQNDIYNSEFDNSTKCGTPIDPELTRLQLWRFSLINTYVTDALNTRPPNTILEGRCPKRGLCRVTIHTAYKMSHNSYWSTLVYISIWIHLCLIIYEPGANIDMIDDNGNGRYPVHLYFIEAIILFIYCIDVYLHYISHDADNYWDLSWAKLIVVCIVLNCIDMLASIILNEFILDGFLLRIGAVLRPIFLITRSQFLRATCRSIFNSIPNVLDVLLLVCLYILMFAVLGYVLFSQQQMGIGVHVSSQLQNVPCDKEAVEAAAYDTDCTSMQDDGNINFETLFSSYLSLFVLMSTANYPDVMMPSFHANKTSGFFFVAFIAFGIYYLMSIIFAVIYHQFHGDNARFVGKMTDNRAKALDAAFKQMVLFSKELQLPSYQLDDAKVETIDFNAEKIYFSLFRRFLQFRRKGICVRRTRVLYNAMCEARARTQAVKLQHDEGIGISREGWQNLYKFVNVEIFRNPSYAVEFRIKQSKDNVMFTLILGDENMYSMDGGCCQKLFLPKYEARVVGDRKQCQCCFLFTKKISFAWLRFRALLYRMFTHKIVSKIIDLLVWIGTLIVIYELQLSDYTHTHAAFHQLSDALLYLFVMEVTLRFIAFGKYFLKDAFNILDFVVVYASVFFDAFNPSNSNGIVAFRLLRFVRALGTIERFKLIISTSVTVLNKVGVLFSLEFCVFYIYAVIGVFCYGGLVTKEASLEKLYGAVQANDVDGISFWGYIRDNYYYDNNMNYIANTLMVMVELTVVNQWHAVTRMYRELSSPWAYLYFYSFYFVSVLIVTNVLTAFIFDAFIIQFEAVRIEHTELNKKKSRQAEIEKKHRLRKEKQIQSQTRKNQKNILQNVIRSKLSMSTSHFADKKAAINMSYYSTDKDGSDGKRSVDCDILDDYIDELNESDKEDWHKWIELAMLYEFDTDDVLKGVWLYDREKTTADFYEQIYGHVSIPFEEYLRAWDDNVDVEQDEESEHYEQSMSGDIFITRNAIKAQSVFDIDSDSSTVRSVKDRDGNVIKMDICGPKQSSMFSQALSTAPQFGFAPKIRDKQLNKASKLLDLYVPPTQT